MKSNIVKNYVFNTLVKKYGTNKLMKIPEILKKYKKTSINNYGVDHPMKLTEIKNKVMESNSINFFSNQKEVLRSIKLSINKNEYINALEYCTFKCEECGFEFESTWNQIQQGRLCPKCFPKIISIAQTEIYEFLKEFSELEEIILNNKDIIKPKHLDIFIPSKNTAIEYNGLYWHSENFRNKTYHIDKTIECAKKGYRLIHIFEDEWIFKKDIVKNRLKRMLNLKNNIKKIHARKCIIKEIEPRIKNEFLDKFHLQGKDYSVIKLGAFYNNDLVSVMTFSHGNISKGSKKIDNIWELNRFCSDYKYNIPGIASKLLTHFKRNYAWKEIFSYADRRWSNGDLYYKLGFEFSYITDPNYWYVKGFDRIHRFSLRKKSYEPKNIPEHILRENEGYERIWDCGNYKFIMKKDLHI